MNWNNLTLATIQQVNHALRQTSATRTREYLTIALRHLYLAVRGNEQQQQKEVQAAQDCLFETYQAHQNMPNFLLAFTMGKNWWRLCGMDESAVMKRAAALGIADCHDDTADEDALFTAWKRLIELCVEHEATAALNEIERLTEVL